VQRLRPVERFHRMCREGLEALGRMRRTPSLAVERAEPINVAQVEAGGG
jgi:hypothetical protein